MLNAFLDTLPPAAVVVEAGAYRGEDTTLLASACEHVHAFEPVSFPWVARVANRTANVTAWELALGDECGRRDIWISGGPHSAASSLLAPKEHLEILPEITFEERKTVEVTTLEAWAAENEIGPVHGLWLDLQGMELAALKAAGPVLDSVVSIVCEVSEVELYEGVPLWLEVSDWLASQGFQLQREKSYEHKQADLLVTRG